MNDAEFYAHLFPSRRLNLSAVLLHMKRNRFSMGTPQKVVLSLLVFIILGVIIVWEIHHFAGTPSSVSIQGVTTQQ